MNGNFIIPDLIRAESIKSRIVGLIGKNSLSSGQGLLITPCSQVHTMFMRFTIDVIFLDRENTVVEICRSLRPWRLSPLIWKASSVLEVAEGQADAIRIGDKLKVDATSVSM